MFQITEESLRRTLAAFTAKTAVTGSTPSSMKVMMISGVDQSKLRRVRALRMRSSNVIT